MSESINLQKIVTVKGKPGLYFLKSFNPKGYHLQSFQGGSLIFVSNEKGRVLALGNVDLQLKEGTMNLLNVFQLLHEQNDARDSEMDLVSFFQKIVPELDMQTVHESHLTRIIKWFDLIEKEFQMTDIVNEEEEGLKII